MEYGYENRVMQREKMKNSLIEAYIKARSIEEFLVEASLKYDDAPRRWIRAFKMHHFKKEHPVAWTVMNVSMSMLIGVQLLSALLITNDRSLTIALLAGALACIAISVVNDALHGEMMRSIEWHEHGCPIDY